MDVPPPLIPKPVTVAVLNPTVSLLGRLYDVVVTVTDYAKYQTLSAEVKKE